MNTTTTTTEITTLIERLTSARQTAIDWRPAGLGLEYHRTGVFLRREVRTAAEQLRAAGIDPDLIPAPARWLRSSRRGWTGCPAIATIARW